ncbi:MAG: fumarylacetoacetate hydrolase family protein [Candidatus Sumerlaeia bacterium]|nr:fumarylacetoacetate hydrolase family protein [Candidatus Sumerlaeia bacterium]
MRLCTVSHESTGIFFGVELRQRILRVQEAAKAFDFKEQEVGFFADSLTYFQNLPKSEKALRKLLNQISAEPKRLARPGTDGAKILLDKKDVTWLPPIQRPGKFLCIGLNYKDHCTEQNREAPKKPMVFNKFATSLVGHGGDILLPLKLDSKVDYEAELGVVIGKTARRVTKRTAMKHVGGYMIVNDVSLRDIQATERQWSRAKGFDGSGPCGPSIVTPDEIPDPQNLGLSCLVNGTVLQKSNTNEMIFPIAHLISFISQAMTLEPGDVISTGTPAGVGTYRNPEIYLTEGDVVEVRIDRLGSLVNKCVKN